MKHLIQKYIEDQKLAWTAATIRSEQYRLNAVAEVLEKKNPALLWQTLEQRNIAPYARVTTWTRVCRFVDWCIAHGYWDAPNPYVGFRRKNARLFKNTYKRNLPQIQFNDARERIEKLEEPAVRRLALELLLTGLRYFERKSVKNGWVTGKGGKHRRVFLPQIDGPEYTGSYLTFVRKLAKIGLRPHDLRKLCLSQLVENGANEFELCQAAGWSSLQTASSYIKADEDKLRKLFQKVQR